MFHNPDISADPESQNSGKPESQMPFGRWLLDQKHRTDDVGLLAKACATDPKFPRDGSPRDVSARLNLLQADPELHEALETAEMDWLAF